MEGFYDLSPVLSILNDSQFTTNNATFGGVILSFNSRLTMKESEFTSNNVDVAGAVLVTAATTIMGPGITSYL